MVTLTDLGERYQVIATEHWHERRSPGDGRCSGTDLIWLVQAVGMRWSRRPESIIDAGLDWGHGEASRGMVWLKLFLKA